jgi:hypothetical protein
VSRGDWSGEESEDARKQRDRERETERERDRERQRGRASGETVQECHNGILRVSCVLFAALEQFGRSWQWRRSERISCCAFAEF